MRIEAFQRRDYFACVVKLSVVIIFNYPAIVLAVPVTVN